MILTNGSGEHWRQANYDMCYKTANPLGSCSCDQQLFINEDCSQGFLCREDVQEEDERNDGCLIVCNPGWHLVADPRQAGSLELRDSDVPDKKTTCYKLFYAIKDFLVEYAPMYGPARGDLICVSNI